MMINTRKHHYPLRTGISRTPEFEKKRLACYGCNIGTKCGHGCLYCSTGAVLRMHPSFKACGENPFGFGYSIVDPDTPLRVARDAKCIRNRGLVQLCTLVDAWAPEAKEHDLGRRCLQAILEEPGWSVRVLTKNVAVQEDFGLVEKHRDRVLVGLSITATPDKGGIISVLEPNASPIRERMAAVKEAHRLGIRTYAMFCPLILGIADSPEQIDELVRFALECGAEEIFVEPANPRGPGLRLCQEALEANGFRDEASAIERIRKREHWSEYVMQLIRNVQASVHRHSDIGKLRFLLYPSGLLPGHVARIRQDDAGVIWLGDKK
jgi:DNA repair photolyase